MAITRIERHEGIGETVFVAYSADEPVALHVDLWDEADRLHLGQVLEARLRYRSPDGRGAFLESPTGETLFMERAPAGEVSDGTLLTVRVAAEARRGKHARVIAARPGATGPASALDAWRASLPDAASIPVDEAGDPDALNDILSFVLGSVFALPGGGTLNVDRTRALTAADVDTAGRVWRGRAGDRSAAINTQAASALGRWLALAGMGGLVVLDCVAPITPPQKQAIKTALMQAFRMASTRKIAALAPSPFGLLEASLAWGPRPISDTYLDAKGAPAPRTVMLEGLRTMAREARAAPGARLMLTLPESAYAVLKAREAAYLGAIQNRFGARIRVTVHDKPRTELSHVD